MKELQYKPKRIIEFWKYNEDGNVICTGIKGKFTLDSIASIVWQNTDGETSVETIVKIVMGSCGKVAPPFDRIAKDVINLFYQWKEQELVLFNHHPLHPYSEYNEIKNYELMEGLNNNLDLLLISPPSTTYVSKMHFTQKIFPLGIGYLASYIRNKSAYKVDLLNLWQQDCNEVSLKKLFLTIKPKVIGLSCMTDNFMNGVKIAEIAKAVDPNIKVIMGGPHPTFRSEETLRNNVVVDYVIRAEGEITLLELLDNIFLKKPEIKDILGITYHNGNEVVNNQTRPFNRNLDSLPFPDRGEEQFDSTTTVNIHTSRGCPGRCIFCCAAPMSGNQYRVRSAKNVVAEMETLYNRGGRRFLFSDDTFTVNIPRLREIISLIREKKWNDIIFSAESRIDIVNRDISIFKELYSVGCRGIQFGVEAGSQKMLNLLKKDIKVEWIFEAVNAARSAGLNTTCTLLIGHPYDTEKTIEETLEFSKSLQELGANVFLACVVPYPGSDIRERMDFYDVTIEPVSYDQYLTSSAIMSTNHMTRKQIRNAYFDTTNKLIAHKSILEQEQVI